MRLYTRGQLVCAVVFSIIVTSVGVGTISYKISKNNEAKKTDQENQIQIEEIATSESEEKNTLLPVSNSYFTQDELQNINIYEKCNEAVVNINTKVTTYDWFLEPYVQDGGSGSGSIIDKRGYILTNVHVIQNATIIYVSLFDGTQYEAKIVGQDLDSDLAVIKFDPPEGMDLKTISFGDSTNLKVGQKVIAIGNPF
ncbi:MAG: trypsin-like peptidase domain-containing protein, partial [Treponema sp.]|nr:trypsin-like peptidase domain-containing protein [Treponema sp.]